jgi:hypothetical protein
VRCIICLEGKPARADGTGEHVVSKALGGSFTITSVCEDCDNRLGGTADAWLAGHVSILQRRQQLNLRGHRGTVPDPVMQALKKPHPVEGEDGLMARLRQDPETGASRMVTDPRVELAVSRSADGSVTVDLEASAFKLAAEDRHLAEKLVKKALRRKGVAEPAVVEELWTQLEARLIENEGVIQGIATIRLRTGGHHLGVAKIAYEMAWRWLGDAWLDDPTSVPLRQALNGDASALARAQGFLHDDVNFAWTATEGYRKHVIFYCRFRYGPCLYLRQVA